MKLKKFNKDRLPFYKRWKFFLVWFTLSMAFLLGYDAIHDLPQNFYSMYPESSQDLVFWAWIGANVIVSLVMGALVTVLDSSLDWFQEKRKEWGWWGS